MQFEVNGRNYFLTFAEGQWVLVTPTDSGLYRLQVHNDFSPMIGDAIMLQPEEGDQQPVN